MYERRRIVYSPTQLIVNILVSQKRRSVNKVSIEDLQILVEDFTFSKSPRRHPKAYLQRHSSVSLIYE